MHRKLFALVTATALLCPPHLSAQAPTDAAVAKGIKEVEDGELDAAIFTLDAAARRLSGDPARTRDLAQAYLYLGVAYLGKGQELAARTKFKEAVQQLRELRLSPDQFPPKVIDLFESARAEVAAPAAPAPNALSGAAPAKKGGSKTPLILVGIGAVAGGIALAAKGGGGSSAPPATPVGDTRRTVGLGPEVLANAGRREVEVTPTAAGTLDAQVSWTEPTANLILYLDDASGQAVVVSDRTLAPGRTRQITAPVTVRLYRVGVLHCGGGCQGPLSTSNATFTLQIKVP